MLKGKSTKIFFGQINENSINDESKKASMKDRERERDRENGRRRLSERKK